MPASLPVTLNKDRLHRIDVAPTFTTSGAFTIDLVNEGEAVHVHLHLDDDLSTVARLSANNHFVEADTTRPIELEVRPLEEPRSGKLKVVTGYGNETEYVDVTIEPVREQKSTVAVDENLSRPQRRSAEPTMADRLRKLIEESTVPIAGLAGVAIGLALAVVVVTDSAVVLLLSGVVILAIIAALVYLLR